MSDALYKWYKDTKRLMKEARNGDNPDHPDAIKLMQGWQEAIDVMEAACPELKHSYARNCAVQDTFTREQIDFICYQIGDWYLEWKDRIIVDLKQGTHRLGYAKEQLKDLICGD